MDGIKASSDLQSPAGLSLSGDRAIAALARAGDGSLGLQGLTAGGRKSPAGFRPSGDHAVAALPSAGDGASAASA
ncbi:hypothetical protein H5392_01815 [Tessaracoccus sp. MC1865]|uniref:hypothetical protein n=1 Tax=Tessaracoccus sp. MC1865 TaxID=2760310 RepID=UPI0015FFC552|nr:hypothetical protein [Tessaracoccus sp. MC1865]MBB1482594.1 hypothetical protein [Tessaracoccus sp. MC1865]QTO37953.1 hypothetical protein J7D54_02275 [Tessaracoccus sp. MC1865]